MNGRIYDPLLGRFLSADLIVQDPASLQSYNRYSYVWNNPLRFTDTSGFAVTLPIMGISWENVKEAGAMVARFSGGVAAGWGEANHPNPPEMHTGDPAVAAGRVVGNQVAIIQGVAEVLAGGSLVGGSGAVEVVSAGTASPVAIPGAIAGTALAAHGSAVTLSAARHMKDSVRELKNAIESRSDGAKVKAEKQPTVDKNPPSAQRERIYREPPPGEAAKHGERTRSGPRGEISRKPKDGQTALDHSVSVKSKENGELRVGIDKTNGEVVVFDREGQTGSKDVFHGHVPDVLKQDVRNIVRENFPEVRVNDDGTWKFRKVTSGGQ